MDLDLRFLVASDREALADILARTPHFNAEEVGVALELIDEALTLGDATTYRVIVAADRARAGAPPVGYVCFGRTPMTAGAFDLYWIVVDPALRGGGVGKRLWTACAEAVVADGGYLVRIETSSVELYGDTQRFYDRIGFREVARIADFYRPEDDLITYVWRA